MTNPQCFYGTGCCWLTCAGAFFGWWVLASVFVWLSWNRVIVTLFKMKPAKLWQAMLLLATVCLLVLPKCYLTALKMKCGRPSHCNFEKNAYLMEEESEDMEKKGPKGDCPYMKRGQKKGSAEHKAEDGQSKED